MVEVILWIILKIAGKDGEKMMAMLFACRVVEGRTTFEQVPAKLKGLVAQVLKEDFGLPELVPEEFSGTAAQ